MASVETFRVHCVCPSLPWYSHHVFFEVCAFFFVFCIQKPSQSLLLWQPHKCPPKEKDFELLRFSVIKEKLYQLESVDFLYQRYQQKYWEHFWELPPGWNLLKNYIRLNKIRLTNYSTSAFWIWDADSERGVQCRVDYGHVISNKRE